MPWAGGSFSRTDGTRTGTTVWAQAKAAAVKIIAAAHDTHDQDIATGVNQCVNKDGSNAFTGDADLGNNQLTNVGAGVAATDAATIGGTETLTGKTVTHIKLVKGADVASATALTLLTDGNYFDITGTTTVTSIATLGVGIVVKLHFDGALILTHHATDLILPGAANITTAAGDEAEFVEYATGDWRCTNYQRAAGAGGLHGYQQFTTSGTYTPTPGTTAIKVQVQAVGAVGGATGASGASQNAGAGGGGGGGYAEKLITTVAATSTITIGAAGVASSFADGTETLTAQPGSDGAAVTPATVTNGAAGAGGTASGGDINLTGGAGAPGVSALIAGNTIGHGGPGGNARLGGGGLGPTMPGSGNFVNGGAGANYGGGGSGAVAHASAAAGVGGAGGVAIIRVWEYR